MNKQLLKDYTDACAAVNEARRELKRIKNKKLQVQKDVVKSSLAEFPYTKTTVKIEGATQEDILNKSRFEKMQENNLKEMIKQAESIKLEVEKYMMKAPIRIQRIIRYKYFDNLSWEEVADIIGRGCTGESLRKELYNFIKKNK